MIITCSRCGTQTPKVVNCDYCKKVICNSCIKSQKRKKVGRIYICKSCWSLMPSRKRFKSA